MSESYRNISGEPIIAVRFRKAEFFDDVVIHLLEAATGTGFSLLTVAGDGERVYPFEGRNPALRASLWCAELIWLPPILMPECRLEAFLKRAELFLELPGGGQVQLEGDVLSGAEALP